MGHPLYYAAAATTAIAGLLHLILDLTHFGSNILGDTFFIVAGIAQIFWALPMTKRWGKIWYYVGIAGTVILIILWALTRVSNPITGGRSFPVDEWGIAISLFEIAYIVITGIIVAKERKRMLEIKSKNRITGPTFAFICVDKFTFSSISISLTKLLLLSTFCNSTSSFC